MSVRSRMVVATTLVVTVSVTSHKLHLARSKQTISHKVMVSTLQNASAIVRAGHRKPRNNVVISLPLQICLHEIYEIFASSFWANRITCGTILSCRIRSEQKNKRSYPEYPAHLGLIRVALPIQNYYVCNLSKIYLLNARNLSFVDFSHYINGNFKQIRRYQLCDSAGFGSSQLYPNPATCKSGSRGCWGP